MSDLPCGRDACIGTRCGNFNDPKSRWFKPALSAGCMGGAFPPWAYADDYLSNFKNAKGATDDEEATN